MAVQNTEIFRLADGDEATRILALHAEIVGNVDIPGEAVGRKLEVVRVAEIGWSIDGIWGKQLRGLVAASAAIGESGAYWISSGAVPSRPEDDATEQPIWVDLPKWAQLITQLENAGEQFEAEHYGPIDGELAGSLFNAFADSGSLFSPNGSWISTSWDSGDVNAMAGDSVFMGAYRDACPDVIEDVLSWTYSLGELFARRLRGPAKRRPRQPRWLSSLTVSEPEIIGYEFENTTLEAFLSRLYGADLASEIWKVSREMEDARTNPVYSDAPMEVARWLTDHPELREWLGALWTGAATPKAL
jgi:hypothetical protein